MGEKLKIQKSRKKEKWHLFSVVESEKENILSSTPNIEILGNKEVVIDGCKGVFEYSDSYIKLKLKKGVLIISGSDLNIASFENSLISLKGRIVTLEFC